MEDFMDLHLETITPKNRAQAERLCLYPEQISYMESVSECLSEADQLPLWRPTGIYDGSQLIGFAMYGFYPDPSGGRLWLDRLLIDHRFQGKGYGTAAIGALLTRLREEYREDQVYLSVYDHNQTAIRLYSQLGFAFTGELDTKGERIMVYSYPSDFTAGT